MQEKLIDVRNGKEQPWAKKKIKTQELANIYEWNENDSKANRVRNCATHLEFKIVSGGKKKLNKANFCQVRLCPMCAWRRSNKIFAQTAKIMNYMKEHTTYRYIFLTLTSRNVSADELCGTIDEYFKAYNMLTKAKDFKKLSQGWFRALEITYNRETKTYHPHFHVIIAVKYSYFTNANVYMSHSKWTALWRRCMRLDYDPIVSIKKVRAKDGNVEKAVAETAKYTVKDIDYLGDIEKLIPPEPDVVKTLDVALHGRRLIANGGEFEKVRKLLKLEDPNSGDLINKDVGEKNQELTYIIEKYNWNIGAKAYYKEQ